MHVNDNCIFCKIVAGTIPCFKLWEDDRTLAFMDVNPGNPGLTMELPLFAWLFMALVLGLIIGSLVTWFRQGRYRRLARERAAEVRGLRDATRPAGPALPKPQS